MSTIEERIAKHENAFEILNEKIRKHDEINNKLISKRIYHGNAIANLKAKLAKQQAKDLKILALKRQNEIENQNDKEFGKALVESGIITEEQKEKVEKLPLPEEKKVN